MSVVVFWADGFPSESFDDVGSEGVAVGLAASSCIGRGSIEGASGSFGCPATVRGVSTGAGTSGTTFDSSAGPCVTPSDDVLWVAEASSTCAGSIGEAVLDVADFSSTTIATSIGGEVLAPVDRTSIVGVTSTATDGLDASTG
ncbi:hypothetical protein [Corallococcus soli]|uniref:hypothetical protein n=1 Tax=Corallococcus soli TaxID=2710757 RepID=UPI0039EF2912